MLTCNVIFSPKPCHCFPLLLTTHVLHLLAWTESSLFLFPYCVPCFPPSPSPAQRIGFSVFPTYLAHSHYRVCLQCSLFPDHSCPSLLPSCCWWWYYSHSPSEGQSLFSELSRLMFMNGRPCLRGICPVQPYITLADCSISVSCT